MQNNKIDQYKFGILLTAFIGLLSTSCVQPYLINANKNYVLDKAEKTGHNPFGGWVHVDNHFTNSVIRGELLAIQNDSLFITSNKRVWRIAVNDVKKATCFRYKSDVGKAVSFGMLGLLSSLSHGYYFLLSGPVWMLTVPITASNVSKMPILEYPANNDLTEFNKYSRFPQGIPAEFRFSKVGM